MLKLLKMRGEKEMKRKDVLYKMNYEGFYPDKFIARKDGSFEVKKSYFYRMGNSEEILAKRVLKVFPEAKIIEKRNDFRNWPQTSYFVVRFII